jgi:hypothetical protein
VDAVDRGAKTVPPPRAQRRAELVGERRLRGRVGTVDRDADRMREPTGLDGVGQPR